VSLGLIAWWYDMMLPFVLVVGPVLIRAAPVISGLLHQKLNLKMKEAIPRKSLFIAMILPSILMLTIGVTLITANSSLLVA
jgi:hypothetical protein